MLLSQKLLQRILGALWLADGLLQLQPQMFTMNMVNGIMLPMVQSQPAPIGASLHWIISVTTQHLTLVNWLIALVQIIIGVLLLADRWVRETIIASIVWALIVWYGGEGMSMLLTGQASALTGAPGAVLLYPLLGLAIYPRATTPATTPAAAPTAAPAAAPAQPTATRWLLSREQLRWALAGFWFLAALLQLQPYWWQPGQISQTLANLVGQGGLNTALVDPLFKALSNATAQAEVPVNLLLILAFASLGAGIALTHGRRLRNFLIASIVASLILWYAFEGFGMILTGMATDFNSGLLLIVLALASWPAPAFLRASQPQPQQPAATIQPTTSAQSA